MPSDNALARGCSRFVVGFCAAAFGTFVPLREEGGGLYYLYAWPGGGRLALVGAVAVLALVLLYCGIAYLARRTSPEHLARARAGAWLAQ